MATNHLEAFLQVHREWDPCSDTDNEPLSSVAANRIRRYGHTFVNIYLYNFRCNYHRDLMMLFTDPPPGIFVVPDESNLRFIHVLIIGPNDTPYEGGLFYFYVKCPTDYPMHPPKIKLMTTDAGRVRFNPNFYNTGKICVSILGYNINL